MERAKTDNNTESVTGSTPGRLIVISGPSGVGKSTVCKQLAQRLDAVISVSATTRPRAPAEVDGKDYYFLSKDEFRRRIQEGQFLEYAEYLGNLYGTPLPPVRERLQSGKLVILEIEVKGAEKVAKLFPDAIMIYLLPPGWDALSGRLHGRARDTQQAIQRRIENAAAEIELARQAGIYRYWVVNDKLDEAVEQIVQIVDKELHDNDRSS